MIIFTDHARIRMEERGASKVQVTATVKDPDEVVEEDHDIRIFRKRHGSIALEVVAEIKKHKTIIITVYWV